MRHSMLIVPALTKLLGAPNRWVPTRIVSFVPPKSPTALATEDRSLPVA